MEISCFYHCNSPLGYGFPEAPGSDHECGEDYAFVRAVEEESERHMLVLKPEDRPGYGGLGFV